jgi:hypothetical protein
MSVRAIALSASVAVAIVSCTSSSLDGFSSGGTASGADASSAGSALVRCLLDTCTADAPECCGEGPDGSVYLRFSCRQAGTCGKGGLVVPCRSSADCTARGAPAGSVCCAFRNGSLIESVECVPRSSCSGADQVLCDRRTPECDGGEVCDDGKSGYVRIESCHLPK